MKSLIFMLFIIIIAIIVYYYVFIIMFLGFVTICFFIAQSFSSAREKLFFYAITELLPRYSENTMAHRVMIFNYYIEL